MLSNTNEVESVTATQEKLNRHYRSRLSRLGKHGGVSDDLSVSMVGTSRSFFKVLTSVMQSVMASASPMRRICFMAYNWPVATSRTFNPQDMSDADEPKI